MLPNGAKDICYNLHIPAPGRVQYYRAECLPFVPDEIKCQLRFPKAYAKRQENLRYLDQVREQTRAFLESHVKQNYFSGESEVPFTASVQEAEVLFSASDNVKELAASGSLKQLHDQCTQLTEAAESQYIGTKDKLENIIDAINSKEDEVVEGIVEDFELVGLKLNNQAGDASINNVIAYFRGGNLSAENMATVQAALGSSDDASSLKKELGKLEALAAAKVEVLKELIELQSAYNDNVENDAAGQGDLSAYKTQLASLEGSLGGAQVEETDASRVFLASLKDATQASADARVTFDGFAAAHGERTEIFSNFLKDNASETDRLDNFKNGLLKHLSMNIVVKESRKRYQKEQFDRLLLASNAYNLQDQKQSLDAFCQEYARIIEFSIEESHGFKSPKIRANYDDYEEAQIRPLNSTIFYYFFSTDRVKRNFA